MVLMLWLIQAHSGCQVIVTPAMLLSFIGPVLTHPQSIHRPKHWLLLYRSSIFSRTLVQQKAVIEPPNLWLIDDSITASWIFKMWHFKAVSTTLKRPDRSGLGNYAINGELSWDWKWDDKMFLWATPFPERVHPQMHTGIRKRRLFLPFRNRSRDKIEYLIHSAKCLKQWKIYL